MTDTTADLLHRLLAQRILVLDGAMGTMIQRLKLTDEQFRGDRFKNHPGDLKGNSDLLVLTRPDDIAGIHAQYLDAGADIIETNTFTATTISQADYRLEDLAYEINVEGARIARRVTDQWTARTPDRPRFVAGSIGPTNRTLSISPDVNNASFRAASFDQLRDAYTQQTLGLIDGGAHVLLLETIFDTLNAKAALVAIEQAFDQRGVRLPLMISVTITDRSGRTLSGQTLDAFYVSMEHAKPFSIGLNCALGAREIRPYLAELARIATCYVSCYPNAGLPNAFGQYDELPEETGRLLHESLSDTFAAILDGNFEIGEDSTMGSMRDATDGRATLGSTPIHMRDFIKTTADHGGAHKNSTIPTHAAYLIHKSLGKDATAKLYVAAARGMRPDFTLQAFAQRVADTAKSMFGVGSAQAAAASTAFASVGLAVNG